MKIKLETLRTALAAQMNLPAYILLLQQFPTGQFINISDTPLIKDCAVRAKVVYVARRAPLSHQPISLVVVHRGSVAVIDCLSGGLNFATLLVATTGYRVRARGNHCSLTGRLGQLLNPTQTPRRGNNLHYWSSGNRLLCVYQTAAVET